MIKKFGMIKHISMTWVKDFSLLPLHPKHCKKIYLKKKDSSLQYHVYNGAVEDLSRNVAEKTGAHILGVYGCEEMVWVGGPV